MKRFLIIVVMLFWCNVGVAKILPDASPEEQYEYAVHLMKIADYETAELALKEFVETHPKHELAGSAQYWYAETFRVRQLYAQAAEAYLMGHHKYTNSPKAPLNTLKFGQTLVSINERYVGCLLLSGVYLRYPEASKAVMQKAENLYNEFKCYNVEKNISSVWISKIINVPNSIDKTKIEIVSMIDKAKDTCKELDFEEGTDRFVDCSFKLYMQSVELAAKNNQTVVMQPQSSGSNTMTIYDPVRDNQRLIDQGMKMITGRCTVGFDC